MTLTVFTIGMIGLALAAATVFVLTSDSRGEDATPRRKGHSDTGSQN